MPENRSAPSPSVSRRSVATGLAWSVPAVAAVSAAPAFATSLIINPGINGWVNVSVSTSRCSNSNVTVTSRPQNPGRTPDGAPFGLFLYDTDPAGVYDNAKLVYWVRGDHTTENRISWRAGRNHSSCWGTPTVGAKETKSDGAVYTPYTWTYTCTIDPREVARDGRLYLEDFEVSATINQQFGRRCEPLDFWAYREIRVDADGAGPGEAEVLSFERKASFDNGGNRSRNGAPDAAGTDAAEATEAAVESSAAL